MKKEKEKLLLNAVEPRTLIPDYVKPLFDGWIRDTHIMLADDGYYYCTGTTKCEDQINARQFNKGIQLFRSPDLKEWQDMGYVWTFEKDGTWENQWFVPNGNGVPVKPYEGNRSLFAPEIHQVKGDFYITACLDIPKQSSLDEGGATFLLKSISKKPEGPYVDWCNGPLTKRIDSTLFVDDDGSVYYIWQDGRIARMKDDMTGFAEDPRRMIQQHYDPEPYCEGVYVFKEKGKYHLCLAIWTMDMGGYVEYAPGAIHQKLSYDCVIATADNIYGPYSKRYTSITGGGHNSFFKGKDGTLYATMFGNPVNDGYAPFVAKAAVIPMEWHGLKVFPRQK